MNYRIILSIIWITFSRSFAQRLIEKISIFCLMFFLCDEIAFSQDPKGDVTFRRMGVHDGNLIATIYFNQGDISGWAGWGYPPPRVEWPKGSGHEYSDENSLLVIAEVKDTLGNILHILSESSLDWDATDINPDDGEQMGWEPLPGYINPAQESPAMSHLPESWPSSWPDKQDQDDPGWPGSWNGYFGRDVFLADQESYFVMDDNFNTEFGQFVPDPSDPSRHGLGLKVSVRGLQWSRSLAEDCIFWLYDITNVGATTYDKIIFGMVFDARMGGQGDENDDLAEFISEGNIDITYSWDLDDLGSGGWSPVGYFGFAFLESPGVANDGLDNDDDGLIDESRDSGPGVWIFGPIGIYGEPKWHWSGDEDGDWIGFTDLNGNGQWDSGEPLNDDLGRDGIGLYHLSYPGRDTGEGDGIPTAGERNFDQTDVDESDQIGLTSMDAHIENTVRFSNDESMWPLLFPGHFRLPVAQSVNWEFFYGSGFFLLEPGKTERFSLAMVLGENKDDILRNKQVVQSIYNANFDFGDPLVPVITAESLWKDRDADGYADGILDGTESFHPGGFVAISAYRWRINGSLIGSESIISATLPTGSNIITLTVIDENGRADSTSIDINVYAQLIATSGPISSAVSSIGDSLFFSSSEDDKVYYFDRAGNLKGTLRTGGSIRSTTTVGPNNIMYVGSSDTRLYAFDTKGSFIWDLPMGDVINASPAVTLQDILYVGVNNNNMFSLNGSDGTINWNYQTSGPINSSASISDSGIVYFGSDDGKLYALNPDGTLKWSFTTGGAVQSSPALDTLGNVYFGSDDGSLYVLNSAGTLLWSYSTSGEINSSPVISADGTVYFGSADSSVYAVSSLGQLVWSYKSDSPVNGTGALSFNGILYIGTDNGKLLALSPTGELLWYYQTDGAITAPPLITVDNMIYIGSADGAIYGMVDPNLLGLSKKTLVENPGQWPTFQQNNQRTGQRAGDVFGPILSVALLVNPIIGSYYDLYVFSDEALQATPIVKLNDTDIEMTLESQVGDHVYHSSVHLTQIGMNAVSVTALDLVGNESEFESSFTFGKLAFNTNNLIRHNELGITFMIPGNHLMREGNLLLSSLELTDNMSQLKKVYPSLDFSAKRSDGDVFVIETNAVLNKDFKLSHLLKDNSAVSFYRLTSSGWQSLTTYTDESHSTVWAYSGEPGIYGIFEGGELTVVPTEFNLSDAFPNPFNLSTTIRYVVPVQGDFREAHSSKVSLNIYNIRGQLVKKVVSREQTPGMYEVRWNGTNESGKIIATGIYLMRLSVGDNITTKKLTLLK